MKVWQAASSSIDEALARYRAGQVVTGTAEGVRVYVDRPLPFLFVARSGGHGAGALLSGESAFVTASRQADVDTVRAWVRELARAGSERFGAFLVIEVWDEARSSSYVVRAPEREGSETVAQLVTALAEVGARHHRPEVELLAGAERGPDDAPPLLSIPECHELGVLYVGVSLPVTFRDPESGATYPLFQREYQAELSRALRRAAFVFTQVQTDAELSAAGALGPRRVDERVWTADAELARVERAYSFLLLVSPTNADDAWDRFSASEFRTPPAFHYRLLPVDPALLKRRLYAVDLESVADPALGYVLRDKRAEIDRQISMLADRQTPSFLYGSMRLYGATTPSLRALAHAVLEAASNRPIAGTRERVVDAMEFVARAQHEIAAYEAQAPVSIARPQLRPDVVGLMVSDGVLMVGRNLKLAPARVEALIHHEVGTHVLTHANGSAQPLAQLATGLADYDEFQEGIAVVSEYLAGGLTVGRLRLLAARVLAVASVEGGASFLDTFALLRDELRFTARGAFAIAQRVHQCGGFTRDMIYLRGLAHVLELLAAGTDIEALFYGKFAAKHIAILDELRARGVLRAAPLRPRVLDIPGAAQRLARLHAGMTVTDLLEEAA